MANRINPIPQPIVPQPSSRPVGKSDSGQATSGVDFGQLLREKMAANTDAGLKFSAHAEKRLESRHINFSDNQLAKLDEAVEQAAEKGSRDSLVLMNNIGLVVSVKNRTVVTAVDSESMSGNVFTNIDSVVVVKD